MKNIAMLLNTKVIIMLCAGIGTISSIAIGASYAKGKYEALNQCSEEKMQAQMEFIKLYEKYQECKSNCP